MKAKLVFLSALWGILSLVALLFSTQNAFAMTQCQAEGGVCVALGQCRAYKMSCPTVDTRGNSLQCGGYSGCFKDTKNKGPLIPPACDSVLVAKAISGCGRPAYQCTPSKYKSASNVVCLGYLNTKTIDGLCSSPGLMICGPGVSNACTKYYASYGGDSRCYH